VGFRKKIKKSDKPIATYWFEPASTIMSFLIILKPGYVKELFQSRFPESLEEQSV
jgi:hypothetical protein